MTIPRRFSGMCSCITVAINFDEQSQPLIKIAEGLCQRAKMRMRLVHVIEPWVGRYWATSVAGGVPMMDVIDTVESEQHKIAQLKLNELAKLVNNDIDVTTNVIIGTVADSIIADATSIASCLIISGAAVEYRKFMPRGFSTALSLMANAHCPVLVVPKNSKLDTTATTLKLLVADDLSDNAEPALATAIDLGKALQNVEILHVHVNTVSPEYIHDTFTTVMATTRTAMSSDLDLAVLENMMLSTIASKLNDRLPIQRSEFQKQGGKYATQIATGKPSEEIAKIAKTYNADMILFGRHTTLHKRPFQLGQVPFHTMLAQECAVLIAPKTY